ncbi:hypothetical protein J7T55_010584 [Diaporthe amygdali]|uniref:uncharacterized protein n=1 Tax=Phomopsis amygdali TaxID=1214568 RepID=UPI0022FE3F67|nr:uncharacterized protein J7T55_010584 [Diaporthe amygdali]KAJ0115761.1 hypothetical protein J7T55_010584 [Diaporthe amygdali]
MNTQTFAARLSTLPPSRRDVLTAVFRKAQDIVLPTGSRWPDPENSIGRYIGKTKWYHIWEATGPARDVFNKIAPSIKAYLEDAVEPISSRVTWSMYMIGRVPSLTSPSIIFCCGVLEHRRHVRNTIKYSGILSGYSGIKTGHLPRPPDFNQLVPLADEEASQYWDGNIMLLTSRFKSPCGSQLFVNAHGPDSEGLSAKATIGGVIQLGDHCYYTTAAHALLPTPYSASGHEALLPNQDYKEGDDALSLDSSVGVDSATTHPLREKSTAAFSPEHSQISEKVLGKSKDTQIGKGDIPSPGDSKSHHLTDNSPSFIANPEEMLLKPTGRPFITSMGPQGQSTGLDYVLINMSSRERIVENMISLGHYDPSILKVQSVSRSNPRDMEVFAVTRRGAIKGYVSGTPTYSSAPGKRTFSKMFKVNLDGPLYRGDCGTWVIDATDGDLFGHIVIGSPGDRTALLTPFADIFDDIFLRLGETPTFPTATNDIPFGGFHSHQTFINAIRARCRYEGAEYFPEKIATKYLPEKITAEYLEETITATLATERNHRDT